MTGRRRLLQWEDDWVHLFDCDEDGRKGRSAWDRGGPPRGGPEHEACAEASLGAAEQGRQNHGEPELRIRSLLDKGHNDRVCQPCDDCRCWNRKEPGPDYSSCDAPFDSRYT